MNTTTKQIDEIFYWKSLRGFDSYCRLRIYTPLSPPDITVVVVSELPDSGTSITNDVKILIQLVRDRYKLNLCKTVWIEHYPPDNVVKFHTYSKVFLAGGKACWQPTTIAEIEKLVKCTFEDGK